MTLAIHPDFRVQKHIIGREEQPLVVIDNLVADADELVEMAASKTFGDVASYYPGVRAKAPLSYQHFMIQHLRGVLTESFGLQGALRFTACHYSLVTASGNELTHMQRIPHVDSLFMNELAFIHYLFRADLGGTAFYRHRATGYEYVNQQRKAEYMRHVDIEKTGADSPPPGYINGDTPLYEQIGREECRFNRLLVYRRTSLHSGALAANFVPDLNPRTGRLSINGFLA